MSRASRLGALVLLLLVTAPWSSAGESKVRAEARRLLDAGDAAGAVRIIEERFPDAQRDADAWYLLAEGYHVLMDRAGLLKKRGLAKKMKRSLEAALESDPLHVEARRELADFYFYAPRIAGGDKDKATQQLELLERHAPVEAHAARGEHARSDGNLVAARDQYGIAVELGPRKPQHLVALAVLEQQLDRYAESIELLDEVIEADPGREKAYYYRARASAMAGLDIDRGLESAIHYLDHCSKCDDSDRGYGWWRRATMLKEKGNREAAIAAYREALRLNPELDGARRGLKELER